MNEEPKNQAVGKDRLQERLISPDNNPERSRETVGDRTRSGSGGLSTRPVLASDTANESPSQGGTALSQGAQPAISPTGPLAQMHRLIERAGEEPFPDDTIRILSEPIDDALVDIRPDGLIYVSHPHYRDRLDRAFGVGAWALVPLAAPRIQDNRVLYYGFLKARGQYIGDAVGGAQYYPNNKQGTYDNSVEAAKSDCLVRCCKALPMFRECWDREYGDYWKATYASEVASGDYRGGKVWKKHGQAMRNFDTKPHRLSESEYAKPARLIDEQNAHIEAIKHEGKLWLASKDEFNENADDYDNQLAWEELQRKSDAFDAVRYEREEEK